MVGDIAPRDAPRRVHRQHQLLGALENLEREGYRISRKGPVRDTLSLPGMCFSRRPHMEEEAGLEVPFLSSTHFVLWKRGHLSHPSLEVVQTLEIRSLSIAVQRRADSRPETASLGRSAWLASGNLHSEYSNRSTTDTGGLPCPGHLDKRYSVC